MKRGEKPKQQREKYSYAIFLFGQCYTPIEVAHKLDIPYREAKKIYMFFLYSQRFDDKCDVQAEKDVTDYYQKKLEHQEIVERIIKKVKEERQNDLHSERYLNDSQLFRGYLSEYGAETMEIFFYGRSGQFIARWVKEKWEHSPFWINFQSRFYSQRDSCFYYN